MCCGNCVTTAERRPVTGASIRLFVVARLFPACLPDNGYICNKCRCTYKKWKMIPEFCHLFSLVDAFSASVRDIKRTRIETRPRIMMKRTSWLM